MYVHVVSCSVHTIMDHSIYIHIYRYSEGTSALSVQALDNTGAIIGGVVGSRGAIIGGVVGSRGGHNWRGSGVKGGP